MKTEKRLIVAGDLWSDIMMLPHNGDMISSEEVEQAIKDAETVDAMELPKGRPGDYLEWHCGYDGIIRYYYISGIYIDKDDVRYDIGDMTPAVDHKNIVRILTPAEMEKEMKHCEVKNDGFHGYAERKDNED